MHAKYAGKCGDEAIVGRALWRPAVDWMWQHKAELASAAVATAFIANPKPFINGAVAIVGRGADAVVRPVTDQISRSINWGVLAIITFSIVGAFLAIHFARNRIVFRHSQSNVGAK
jgi:hypothetical protein